MESLLTIEGIADHPELVDTIARWHWDEWGRADPGGSLASWAERLRGHVQQDRIPTTYVALEGNQLLGSVSMVEHDMSTHRDLSPWLAGMYVAPEHRGKGVGSALVRHLLQEAVGMGIPRLYLYTSTARPFYEKLGWSHIEEDFYEGETVSIMEIGLSH